MNQTHTDPKKTGSLYNIKNVIDTSPVKDDEWWEYAITVKGKTVTINVNGKVVTEWTQPENARRGLDRGGTFALQAHDPGSEVRYKNIRVKRLDSAGTPAARCRCERSNWHVLHVARYTCRARYSQAPRLLPERSLTSM